MNKKMKNKTSLGEKRVRVDFNPSYIDRVQSVKQDTAELINLIDYVGEESPEDKEEIRLIRLAQTTYEEAAMWAVKALTIKK